jgi:hypothetical protein
MSLLCSLVAKAGAFSPPGIVPGCPRAWNPRALPLRPCRCDETPFVIRLASWILNCIGVFTALLEGGATLFIVRSASRNETKGAGATALLLCCHWGLGQPQTHAVSHKPVARKGSVGFRVFTPTALNFLRCWIP